MSPDVALTLALTGIALGILAFKKPRQSYPLISAGLGLIIFCLGLTFALSYISNFQTPFNQGEFIPITIAATIGLILLGLGIMALSWYRSTLENINITPMLPALVTISLLIVSYIYASALRKTEIYFTHKLTPVPTVTLVYGIIMSLLVGLSLRFVIRSREEVAKQKQLQKQILHQAAYDTLTDLPNRALLLDRIEQAITATSHTPNFFALVFIGIDKFKFINDSLGHKTGDKLLQAFASG